MGWHAGAVRASGWSRSHTGRSERIGGSDVKLCGGGGEVVAHSSVWAPHGLSPAGTGCRHETHRFQKNGSTEMARMYAPAVDSRLRNVTCRLDWYVATHLGMPRRPISCWGRR